MSIMDINFMKKDFTLKGFSFWGSHVGIKDKGLDFGVIYSSVPANAHAVFTQSRYPGAPIVVGRKHIQKGRLQAVVVNSKNANVYTGKLGEKNAYTMCEWTAQTLGIDDPCLVLPSSTGIIGKQLDMAKIQKGYISLKSHLRPGKSGLNRFACAIMTSDAYPKWGVVGVGKTTLVGVVKGAGMIEPNLATMLAYFITDAHIPLPSLRQIFYQSVDKSFNAITVDGDTSTSDTALIMANGLAGKVNLKQFQNALDSLAVYLAQLVVADGEGASKMLELKITQAKSLQLAEVVAKSVLNSPLVKTAIYGADPNWGRIIMAIGKVDRKWIFNPSKIKIYSLFCKEKILLNDLKNKTIKQEKQLNRKLTHHFKEKKVVLEIVLGNGRLKKTFWGSDLSVKYVRYNSDYIS